MGFQLLSCLWATSGRRNPSREQAPKRTQPFGRRWQYPVEICTVAIYLQRNSVSSTSGRVAMIYEEKGIKDSFPSFLPSLVIQRGRLADSLKGRIVVDALPHGDAFEGCHLFSGALRIQPKHQPWKIVEDAWNKGGRGAEKISLGNFSFVRLHRSASIPSGELSRLLFQSELKVERLTDHQGRPAEVSKGKTGGKGC